MTVCLPCLLRANCHGHAIEAVYKLLCMIAAPNGYLCSFSEAEWDNLPCADFLIVASSHTTMPQIVPSLFVRISVYITSSSSYKSVARDVPFP